MLSLNSPFLRNTMRKNVKAKKERFTTTAKPTSIDVLQGNKFLHQGLTRMGFKSRSNKGNTRTTREIKDSKGNHGIVVE